ncbi:hypothetical protein HFP15_41215 [Amycolatopsis sp. K13G38]|uniref:Nuclear transport factor 2 family protein n=1 Tax=Amycolatopsis acididurans TaxID=2724524 RepID=A0ABX1JHJ7_9PSEU|nr:Rv3235 family protein [Amycolatopsis acididurans]NKQ59277.1 hypothetical protein [Amycolatopsis acididurans]
MRTAALKPLRPYEPLRDLHRFADTGGQLALNLLPARIPAVPLRRKEPEPLPTARVRAVFAALLDARTGSRPLSRVQGMVHPRLYRYLGGCRPLRDLRFTLRSVRLCRVAPDAYEAGGTAHAAGRTYGLVGRFELLEPGWRCVMFDIVRPRPAAARLPVR